MPITSPVITVTSTAAALVANTLGRSLGDPIPVLITNTGSDTVYLGGPTVSSSAGFPLPEGGVAGFNIVFTDSLWAVCALAETTTVVLMLGRQ